MEGFITSFRARLVGYTGDEAIMRYTPGGTAVSNVSVAYGGGEGRKGTFVRCAFWEESAEIAQAVLNRKGMAVIVEGRPGANGWTGKDGSVRSEVTLTVIKLTVVTSDGGEKVIDLNPPVKESVGEDEEERSEGENEPVSVETALDIEPKGKGKGKDKTEVAVGGNGGGELEPDDIPF